MEIHKNPWEPISRILDQYPVENLARQYKYLVLKRVISANLLALLLQYLGMMMQTLTPLPSPMWYASGTALGFIFLRGYRVVCGLWFGTFLAYYVTSHQFISSCEFASLLLIQAIGLVWMTRKFIYPSLVFHQVFQFWKFCLCSFLITVISSYYLLIVSANSLILFIPWWLANINSILIIGIVWVTTDTYYTYTRAFSVHVNWYHYIRYVFIVAFVLNLLFFLKLNRFMQELTVLLSAQLSILILAIFGLSIFLLRSPRQAI